MIRVVIGHLNKANPDYKHPFLVERAPKSIGVIFPVKGSARTNSSPRLIDRSAAGLRRPMRGPR